MINESLASPRLPPTPFPPQPLPHPDSLSPPAGLQVSQRLLEEAKKRERFDEMKQQLELEQEVRVRVEERVEERVSEEECETGGVSEKTEK